MTRSQPASSVKQELFHLPMNELIHRVQVGRITLREISQPRVKAIKDYILTNLAAQQVYFPTLIGHLEEGSLIHGCKGDIAIIDGSHRLKAFVQLHQQALKTMKGSDEHKKNQAVEVLKVFETTVLAIQLHEGLTLEQIHQFYLDLNSLKKKTTIRKWEFHYKEKGPRSKQRRKGKSSIKTPGQ